MASNPVAFIEMEAVNDYSGQILIRIFMILSLIFHLNSEKNVHFFFL